MSFHDLIGYLVIAASTTLGLFILAVVADLVLAIVLARKKGALDAQKLPQFLGSQFATREFLGMLSLGVAAGLTALGSTLKQGALTEAALQAVAQVALGAMTVGAGAMFAAVVGDAKAKFSELLGGPVAQPTPEAPLPVTIVPPSLPVPPTPPA